MSEDRIEKSITLRASKDRVWQALTDSKEFGHWFGMDLEGPFVAGTPTKGKMTPTKVDPDVAQHQKEFDGCPCMLLVEQIEPQRLFSFRWHPLAIDPKVDYSGEPTTLVAFVLEEVTDGTRLTVTESGFNEIPAERRAKAFGSHEPGWAIVVKLLETHLGQVAM